MANTIAAKSAPMVIPMDTVTVDTKVVIANKKRGSRMEDP
jgi:hypothetical protein